MINGFDGFDGFDAAFYASLDPFETHAHQDLIVGIVGNVG
jgi:hypothetical protein